MEFHFNAGWYTAIFPYGQVLSAATTATATANDNSRQQQQQQQPPTNAYHMAQVDVMILPTKQGYDSEQVTLRVSTLYDKPLTRTNYYHPKNYIAQLYTKWPIVLEQELATHLEHIVDGLLEELEARLYSRRKQAYWVQKRR